jgi:predicted phosphodiesterase
MSPTPFARDVEEQDLNAKNLQLLQSQQTSEREDKVVRFVAIGDTHDEYDDLHDAVDAINDRRDVDFVAHVGDQTNLGLLEEFQWTRRVLSRVEHPLLMTVGNHDAISSGWRIFRDMYGPYDFAFVHNHVKFIVFNSNTLEFPDEAPNRSFLETELSDRQGAEAVVLVTHHPPITTDAGRDVSEYYRDLIRRHDVTLWLHGHVADFKLKRYYGVPVLQVGTFEYHREHAVVTLRNSEVTFDRCSYGQCKRVEPDGELAENNPYQL